MLQHYVKLAQHDLGLCTSYCEVETLRRYFLTYRYLFFWTDLFMWGPLYFYRTVPNPV